MSNVLYSIFPCENFIDLSLYQYGWEQCDPAHAFGPAARNHYLFHYVISGTGMLAAENSQKKVVEYHIKSGQGFMIFPQQICSYIADQKLPWEYAWVEFDGLKAKELLKSAGFSPDAPVYRPHQKDLSRQMSEETSLYCPELSGVSLPSHGPSVSVYGLSDPFHKAHPFGKWKPYAGFLY